MSSVSPQMMRCLITGASGYVGGRLCERLSGRGEVPFVGMVRSPRQAAEMRMRGLSAVSADLLVPHQLAQAMADCDAVVHLAHGDRGTTATRHLVDTAIRRGVRRFVHISTMSVHGPVPGPEAAREETALIGRYDHDYSDSKAEQEEIVQAAHDRGDLPVVILRPTIVYGLGGHFEGQVIDQAHDGVVTLLGGGSGVCNAVFVDDVCDAIEAALQSDRALGEAMFINGDQVITWGEFIHTFAGMVQPMARIEHLDATEALAYWRANPPIQAKGIADRIRLKLKRLAGWRPPVAPWPPQGRVWRETFPVAFANDKAKRLLDWSPQVNFAHGAELTRAWLQSHGRLGVSPP